MTGARGGAHPHTHINYISRLSGVNVNELLKQPK